MKCLFQMQQFKPLLVLPTALPSISPMPGGSRGHMLIFESRLGELWNIPSKLTQNLEFFGLSGQQMWFRSEGLRSPLRWCSPGPRKTENLMGRRQKNLTNFLVSDLALYKDITAGNHSFNNQIWGFPAKFNLQSILDVYFLMIFRAWIKFRYLQYPQIGLTPRAKKSSHG